MNNLVSAQVMPKNLGIIHLIGIGGIGISGIAEVLVNLGYSVQGSDIAESANVERLRGKGVKVFVGHKADNVAAAAVIVKSTAVQDDNPEIQEGRKRKIPILKRAEMLAEILRLKKTVAIAGSHGKTTTTSFMAHLFESADLSPTVINGGIINTKATNAYLGKGDWLVAEADESDGTFIAVPSTVGVVTNIDAEHLEHYGSFDSLKDAFRQFVTQLPFYGFAVVCYDHPTVREVLHGIIDRKIITYGIESEDVDVRATDIVLKADHSIFNLEVSERVGSKKVRYKIEQIKLPMPGIHNISNATAALAVGIELNFDVSVIINGLQSFEGVKRRFTVTGEVDDILIIDDYAHHPQEILATLSTAAYVAEERGGKVIAIVQPHRYTRLRDCFDDFSTCMNDADVIFVADVFEAGEQLIEGCDSQNLVDAIAKQGHDRVVHLSSLESLAAAVNEVVEKHDIVVGMGAGTISKYMNILPDQWARGRGKVNQTA